MHPSHSSNIILSIVQTFILFLQKKIIKSNQVYYEFKTKDCRTYLPVIKQILALYKHFFLYQIKSANDSVYINNKLPKLCTIYYDIYTQNIIFKVNNNNKKLQLVSQSCCNANSFLMFSILPSTAS